MTTEAQLQRIEAKLDSIDTRLGKIESHQAGDNQRFETINERCRNSMRSRATDIQLAIGNHEDECGVKTRVTLLEGQVGTAKAVSWTVGKVLAVAGGVLVVLVDIVMRLFHK